MTAVKPKLLVVDDDVYFAQRAANLLSDRGRYLVTQAHSADEALDLIEANAFDLIIMDVSMPPGTRFGPIETAGGHKTGVALIREIRNHVPSIKVIVNTGSDDHDLEVWYGGDPDVSFLRKTADLLPLLRAVQAALHSSTKDLRPFIVHGRDREALLELKLFLQNSLGFSEPIVLSEMASLGRTVIEKFEHYAAQADLVFVLLTPDDIVGSESDPNRSRARQNVVFELGYFLGLLRRQSGRVFLLYKGDLEIPSDLGGVVYICIDHGIQAAGEQVRRELGGLIS